MDYSDIFSIDDNEDLDLWFFPHAISDPFVNKIECRQVFYNYIWVEGVTKSIQQMFEEAQAKYLSVDIE